MTEEWEDPEEEVPEPLRKRWEQEEAEEEILDPAFFACPHCGKMIEKKSFLCLYCGGRVFYRSGLLGRIKGALESGRFGFVLLAGIILIIIFMLMIL